MDSEPEGAPGQPGSSGAPVKRPDSENDSVPLSWLIEPEHLTLAENVDRLAADFELVTDLGLVGFQGRDWTVFSTELARYGMAVIAGWMRRGLIFHRCRQRGFGGLPPIDRPFDEDEIEEITGETVAKALVHFRRDVLMARKWDYRKGATLRTYFVGQCLIRFANIYRRWWGNEIRNANALTDETDLLDHLLPVVASPAGQAIDRATASVLLETVKDPRVRVAMYMTADGRTQAEIAEALNVTVKAVERMLANERQRLRERKAG